VASVIGTSWGGSEPGPPTIGSGSFITGCGGSELGSPTIGSGSFTTGCVGSEPGPPTIGSEKFIGPSWGGSEPGPPTIGPSWEGCGGHWPSIASLNVVQAPMR